MATKIQYKPVQVNLSFPRGDKFSFKTQLQDANKEAIILEQNDKLFLTVKSPGEATPVIQLTIGNGIAYADNYYTFTFSDTDTDDLDFIDYDYDVELITSSLHMTLILGTLTLTKEVTYKADEV